MSRSKVLRIFLIVLVLAAMVVSVVACTPREDTDIGIEVPPDDNVTVGTPITKTEANRFIGEGLTNRKQKYTATGSEEWFVLDFALDFLYNDYTSGSVNTSAIHLDFKANFHLSDNMRSQLLLEFRDNVTSALLLGIYYYEQVLYVSVLPGAYGYSPMNYYMPELNLTKIGQTLSGLLDKIGGLDPAALIMGIVAAQSKIDDLLAGFGVAINPTPDNPRGMSIDGLVNSIAQGLLFDLESGSTVEYSSGNSRRVTRVPVKANTLLGYLRDASFIGKLIGIPNFQIGWTLFGFPDFDPLLEQFLGFSIRTIRDKDWPPIFMTIGSIDRMETVRRTDGSSYEGYVMEGMTINIDAQTDETHPMKEFDVNIDISPFLMTKTSLPADINFSGKNLSTSGTKYTEGGLLNFEASLSIEVDAAAGTVLTLDDVLGKMLDLGAIGSMPIKFGSNTPEGDRTHYEFNAELKVDLDMFDGDNNRLELNVNYDAGFGSLQPIISVYLIGDTVYVDTTAIGGENYALPNLSLSGLDVTSILFGSEGLLNAVMPFLDPNADTTAVPPSGSEEGGAESYGSGPENAGTGFNIGTLLRIIANFYETEDPETGEIIPPTWILPDLTEDPANTPMSIRISGDGLSAILGMFMDGAILGIRDVIISVPLSSTAIDDNENSLFKVELNVSDDLSLKIKLNGLAYMGRPDFRYDSREEINAAAEEIGRGYNNLFGDNTYHIEMGGFIDFGIDKSVNNSAAEVDLGVMLSGVLSNLLINIGVTDFARTSIGYKILANFDVKNTVGADMLNYISFGGSSLAVHFYLPTPAVNEWQTQRFLSVYYDGTSDYLYIDFTNLGNLQHKVSLFKFINGQLPNVSVKLGLEGKLTFRNTLTMFLPKNQTAAAAVLDEFGLFGYAMTGSAYEINQLDIMGVVGQILSDIAVSENALSIVASAQLLNVLMEALGVKLSLPEVNLSINLDVINGDTDVLQLHFGLIDKASSENREFVSLNVVPLTHAQITAGEGRVFDVSVNDFVNIEDLMKNLSVTFQLHGNLYLEGNANYEGFDLDDLLGEMLGGALGGTLSQILKVYVETKELNAHIDFTLRLNLNLSEMSVDGGTIRLPNIGNSELHLNVASRESGDIFNVYLKGGTLYVELEAFGMANLAIDGVGDMLFGMVNGSAETASVMANASPDTSDKNYSIGNLAQASNTVALGVQVWISPYTIALTLAGDQLSNLLSELLGLKKSSVTVQDTEIEIDTEDGIALSVATGIETINLNVGLSGLGIWFGDGNSGNNYVISVPNLNDPSYWHRGNLSSITESVHIKLEAEVSFSSEPQSGDVNRLDLSPVLGGILPGVSLDAFLDIFGADTAGIVLSVDAYLNLNNILASTFRAEMRDYNGNPFLVAVYKGYVGSDGAASGDLYVKTSLFGLSPDKFTLIPNVMGLFGGSGSALSETANTAAVLANTPEKDRSAFAGAAGYTAFADYIKVTFAGGKLAVIVTEDVLVSLLSAFGIDLSAFFDERSAEIKIEVSATPLYVDLSATVSGINLKLGLGGLSVDFAKPDSVSDDLTDVAEIRDFGAIGVDVTAELNIESLAGADGKVYFDNLVKNLLNSLNVDLPLDKEVLSGLGVLVELIGKNGTRFEGSLYIRIQAVINLTDINRLYLSLKVGTVLENDKLEVGDVLDVAVFGDTRTAVDAAGVAVSSFTANVYVDAEKLTGIKPFVVQDVMGLISSFTATAMAADVAVTDAGGKVTVYENPLAKLAAFANSDSGDQRLAAQILLQIAVEYEDYGMSSPIVASVTSGAIYALLMGLAGIDISAFLDGHDPEVSIGLLGGNTLLTLNAGLKDALKVSAVLDLPTLSLSPVYPEQPNYGRVLNGDNLSASVEVEGTFDLQGKTDGSDSDVIKIDTILNGILGGTQFGVLIDLLTDISATVHFRLAATVNVKALMTGDWNGLDALLELRGGSGKLLVGVYYFDENGDGQNDLLLDLSALNAGKMRIDGFARFMKSLFDTFAPPSASEAFIEAQNNAPLNANGERADNTGLLQAYINLTLGMDRVLALHVGADVVALLVTALNITDNEGNPLIGGEEIVNTVNGILALDIWAFDIENGGLLGLQLSVASYTLGLSLDRLNVQIDPEDEPIVGDGFDASGFGYVGEMTQDFYMKAEMTFGWDMKSGTQVSFGEILSSVLSINNLAVEPVLSILEDISQEFTLSVEAKIHFGNLLANGELLNDLIFEIATGRYDGVDITAMFVNGNMAMMTDSEGNRLLILRSGDETNYTYKAVRLDVILRSALAAVLSDDKGNEVLSLRFNGGNLYVNLEVLGIGKFVIENAFSYLLDIFTPLFGLSTFGYSLEAVPQNASDAAFADYVAKEASVISQFININVSPEAFAVQISSAALFAVLKTLGLDVNNVKLSDSLILDLENTVNSLGSLNISAELLGESRILALKLALNEWMTDADGNKLTDPDKYLSLSLGLNNNLTFGVVSADMPDMLPPADRDAYDVFTDAQMSFATRLEFNYGLNSYNNSNINKEPLSGLLGNYLSDLIIQLGVNVVGNYKGTIAVDVRANIRLLDLINEIMSGQLSLSSIQAEIKMSFNDDTFLKIQLVYGDIFVDLSALNGPKLRLRDFASLFAPAASTVDVRSDAAAEQRAVAAAYAVGRVSENNVMPISIELLGSGLYVVLRNAAFNALFAMLGLQPFEMFEQLNVQAFADGSGVGLAIDIKDGGVDFLSLSLAINELSVRMSAIPQRPTAGDGREPMVPPTADEQREYKSLMDINTVLGSASFEVSLSTRDGAFEFATLLNSLWDASALLGKGLAPKLTLEDVLGDTIRLDLDIVFNTSFYETVTGAHYYQSEGRLVIGGNTYTIVGSDIRDIANRSVGSMNSNSKTFELHGTNYSYTDGGVVRASKGVQRILEGIQVKAHVYSLNNRDYFDLYIYFVGGTAYIDAECLGISKVKIPVNSVMDLIAMFKGGSAAATDINAATAVYSATAPAYYDAMDRLFAAPLSAYNAAGKTIGIVDILVNRDGLFATVGSGLLFGVLRLVGLSDQMVTAIENTVQPEIRLSADNRFTVSLGVDVNAVGENPASISFGVSIITQNIIVDVEADSANPELSIIEPLISAEEKENYISFDELEIYTELNISLSLELLRGNINLDAILDLVIATMKANLNIAETHRIDVHIGAKLGISLKNFLSMDIETAKDAVYGELSVAFEISDDGYNFEQEVINIAIRNDGIFATVNLFDSSLKVRIPDFTVGELLYGMLGFGGAETASYGANTVKSDMPQISANLPVSALYGYAAEGRSAIGGDALEILLSLNSKEFSLEISLLTVTTVLSALGFGEIDLTALVSSIFDGGKLAVNYDKDFYIYLNIGKGATEDNGGYDLTVRLLHDTIVDLSGNGFGNLKSRLDNEYFEGYVAFDLTAILNGENFDILGFVGKLGASVDLTVSAELKEYLIDWSKIFEDNSIDSLLYIQINEALSGAVTLTLQFDIDVVEMLRGRLAIDVALSFKNTQGEEMLSLALRGLGRYGDSPENDLVIMLHVPGTPMPDFIISGSDVDAFMGLDYNVIINNLLAGLGLVGEEKGQGVSLASGRADAPMAAGIIGDDDGLEILPGVNIATLVDSLSLTKGKVAVVLTKNIIEQLLLALFNFPFEDIQGISASIDFIKNEIAVNINLAALADTDETALGFGLALGGLDIALGGRDMHADGCFLGNSDLPLGAFSNISDLKTEIEIRSELLIDDRLISFFDLSDFTNSLLGMDVVLRSGEQLHIAVELIVKIFIDFSDIGNIGLSLGLVYDGKQYVGITFKGDGFNGANSTAYVDLTGLGLPAVALSGIDIETIVRDVMSKLVSGGGQAEAAGVAMPAMAEVLRTYSAEGQTDQPFAAPYGVKIPAEDLQFGTALLLLTVSSKEFALSITGALAASLIHGINESIAIPQFNRLTIGYVEEEDGTLRGLRFTLDEDEMFLIQFGFTGGSFQMGENVQSTITAEEDFAGNTVENISDIDILKNVYLSLHAEVRLKTTNDDETGKSRQIEDMEKLVETVVGMPEGSFDLSLQTSSMVFTFDLEALVNLADFNKTQLYLEIGYGDMLLIGIYYTLPSKDAIVPQAYVDLSGLGLFKAAVTGIDLVGIIGNLLGGFVTDEGLNIGDMISGLLGGGRSEQAAQAPARAANSGPVAMLGNAANAQAESSAKENPTLTVIFTNSEIVVAPNIAVLEKLTGIDLPDFLDLRVSINLKEGLNNLSVSLKIDRYSNSVQISVPVGNGLRAELNRVGEINMPANFTQYGGVNGVSLSLGSSGLNVSVGTRGLINSLVDSVYSEDLSIILEKRNSYWARTKVSKWFDNNPYVGSYGPYTVPENGKGSFLSGDDLGYVDYRHIDDTLQSAYTSAKRSVLSVSRTRTNVLEIDGNLNNNGLHVIVAYNAGRINLKIPSLIIQISVKDVLDAVDKIANTQWISWISWMFDKVMIPINIGAILNLFVPNGINVYTLIINNLIPENRKPDSSLGTVYGTVCDEDGNGLAGVQVVAAVEGQMADVDNIVTTTTDAYGNYAIVGLKEGVYEMLFSLAGYSNISVGSVDVKGLAHSKATRKDVYMLGDSAAAPFANIRVSGRVADSSGAGIEGAQIYIDGAAMQGVLTDSQGNFSLTLAEARGQNHAIGVTAVGFVTPEELGFTLTSDNQQVTGLVFEMEAESADTSVTLFQGVLRDADGKPVQHTAVQLWLAKEGVTHLMEEVDENGNERRNLDPVNFFNEETFTVRSDASGRFWVEIPNEYLGDANTALKFKVRSETYNYVNIEISDATPSVPYYLGEITLTERAAHWSQETLDRPIAGIRIRLGADKLDKTVDTDPGGMFTSVSYDLINGVMDGEASTNDSVSYVELWINSDLVANLLGKLMHLLAGKTAGFTEMTTDARLSTQDLVPTGDSNILKQILEGRRYYNENDENVFDFRWNSRQEYALAAHSMVTRLPAAFLATLLGPIIKNAVSGFVAKLIELAAEQALGKALTQIGDNIAALLQFPLPYNVLGGKDLQGNLLSQTWGYDENFIAQNELEKTRIDADGDGTAELTRSYEFMDRAVYVKVTLNAQADALIESASVFINGIRYASEAKTVEIPLPSIGTQVRPGGYIDTDRADAFNAAELDKAAGDGVENVQVMANGAVIADRQKYVNEWIAKSAVESYFIVEDKNAEGEVVNRYYYLVHESKAKDGAYMEISIVNSGLSLRAGATELGGSEDSKYFNWHGSNVRYTPPSEIIFNDPYDPTDFTFIGGSWANESSGTRTNTDTTKTVYDFLPERYEMSFADGTSTGSNGVAVFWSYDSVNFDPKGGSYSLVGACLNQIIEIPVTVRPSLVNPAASDILSGIPAIDPMNYDRTAYLEALPRSFAGPNGHYVFNNLVWNTSDTVVNYAGGETSIKLTYSMKGTKEDSGYQSAKATIEVPVRVMNRTVTSVDMPLDGSINGINASEVRFDPFVETDPVARLRELTEFVASTVEGSALTVAVRSCDASSMRNYRPGEVAAEQRFTVYYEVADSLGNVQRVPVSVVISSKEIIGTTVSDLSVAARTVIPYVDSGIYSKDIGLNLPTTVTVRYEDGTAAMLSENVDYVWGAYRADRPSDVYFKANFADLFTAFEEATYIIGLYSLNANGAVDRNNGYESEFYFTELYVSEMELYAVPMLTVSPSAYYELPAVYGVYFNGGRDRAEVSVEWSITVADLLASFSGGTYSSDVTVRGALFETQSMPNVRVDVGQIIVESVDFGSYAPINPFNLENEVHALFRREDIELRLMGANGMTAGREFFDIIGCETVSGGNLDVSTTSARFKITVANKGYDGNNPDTQVWKQTFAQSLNIRDVSNLYIHFDYVDRDNPNNSRETVLSTVNTVAVSNALDGVMPAEIWFEEYGDRYQITYDVDGLPDDAYTRTEVTVSVIPKAWPAARKTLTVLIYNQFEAMTEDAVSFPNMPEEISSLAKLSLPEYASVDLTYVDDGDANNKINDGGTVTGRLPVSWRIANGGNLITDAGEETVLTLVGRVGQMPFGFFEVEKTVVLTPSAVTDSGISGTLEINPLTGSKQTAVEAAVDGTPVILSIIYPDDIEISYEGREYKNHYVYLAQITELYGSTVIVRTEVSADVTVLSRRVVAVKNQPEGTVYSQVDFAALGRTAVVFDNGEEMIADVLWSGTEDIGYTVQGGVSYVYATVFAGQAGLEHTFRVPVRIRQAVLEAVYYTDGTQITHLSVDPYVGFADLPERVLARFYGSDNLCEINAEWTVSHIVRTMTVEGGEYTAENQNAAELMIYLVAGDGSKYAQQTVTVDVTVENRSIVTSGSEGSETVAVEFTRKDGSKVDLNAGQPEAGTAAAVYDRETNTVTFSMNINPYSPATGVKYSEDKTSDAFYYFDGVTFTLAGGVRMSFDMNGIDYRIYDSDSKLPTVANNLYTGRNVVVEMRMNGSAVYDAEGNQVLAANAAITVIVNVRILNMSYVHGGGFSTEYTVDMYGEWFGDALRESYNAYIGYNDLIENVLQDNAGQTVYVAEGNEYGFVPELISFETSGANPNFTGGTGTVYAKFGNEMGGEQRIAIRLNYLRRVLKGVFDAGSITSNGYETNVPNYYANLSVAANRTALNIKESSINRITNGGTYGDSAFLIDPFAIYDKDTFFPSATVRVAFDDGTEDGLIYDASSDPAALTWDTGRMFVDYYGGVFSVKAYVGEGAATQNVSYRLYVLSRKIRSSRTENPFGGLIRSSFDGIRPYAYMYSGNVEQALAADIFNTGAFEINFEEGAPIRYTLGRTAATGQIVGSSPLFGNLANHLGADEADTVMNFTLDAGQGLNSQGRDVRFYITVPGFGMGITGKQTVSLYLRSIPEKIYDARAIENGSAVTFANYWRDAISSGAMQSLGGDAFHLSNPYYFIMQGGIKMPDRVRIYVNETGNAADGAAASYDINTWWNNSNGNVVRVNYYDQEVGLSFNVDLDNQLYGKLSMSVTPRILATDVIFDQTGTSDNYYGEDEVILLPTNPKIQDFVVNGLKDGFATDDYSYSVSFGNDLTVTFNNINGGGTSRNDINKWNFSGVKWDFPIGEWTAQTATLTLGGRGGQQIKWRFKTVDKTWVNSSISTVQVFEEGTALDFSKIGGRGSQLPTTVKQYFDVNYLYQGTAGYTAVEVPVTYGELLNSQLQPSDYYDDSSRPQFDFDRATGTLTPTSTAATPVRPWQKDDNVGAAVIRWTATAKRAYPSPKKDVGGYVYVAYASKNTGNTTQNTYIVNPTREAFNFDSMAPSLVDWRYRAGMSAFGGVDDEGNKSYSGLDFYSDASNGNRIMSAPIISVNVNARFDTVNLPLYEVQVGNDKYTNFVDWNNADVWYSTATSATAASFTPQRDASGNYSFNGATKLQNGIFDINTSSRQAQSGGRSGYGTYYIVARVPGVAGAAGEVVIAVETVG